MRFLPHLPRALFKLWQQKPHFQDVESLTINVLYFCRYAGIANMKMRDWESTLVQAWKPHFGEVNVWETVSLPTSLSSLAGVFQCKTWNIPFLITLVSQ